MKTYTIKTDDDLSLHARSFGKATKDLPLICLPGLTRNAADFDDLATVLANERQVISLDFRGRARSDRDPEWRRYIPPVYANDVCSMMDQLDIPTAVFCGTSLGGLVTMLLAEAHPARVAGAILNDIGPEIDPAGLTRIQAYTGKLPGVNSWDEACNQVRTIYGDSLPDLTDDDFERLARRTYLEENNGRIEFDYDPNIGRAIREVDMQLGDPWTLYDALHQIPLLILRGEHSDILSAETVARMLERNANATATTIRDRGHAPLLNESDSTAAIRAFLGESL
ncbi:MAG: alpha/beta fold hydrolase [Woeseiaceae bacterium]